MDYTCGICSSLSKIVCSLSLVDDSILVIRLVVESFCIYMHFQIKSEFTKQYDDMVHELQQEVKVKNEVLFHYAGSYCR